MHTADHERIAGVAAKKWSFFERSPGGYLILSALAGIYLGFGIALIFSVWLLNSVTLTWLRRQAGNIAFDWSGVARGLSLAVLLTGIGWVVEYEFGPWWAVTLVLLVYGLGLALVKPLNQSDIELLNRGLRHRARFFIPFARKNS